MQLQTAFANLTGEGGRFSGLLEAQSQTLGGQLSTIRDNAAQVLRLGTNYLGVTRLVQGLTSRFSELAAFFVGKLQPAQKTQIDQTRDIQAEFNLEVVMPEMKRLNKPPLHRRWPQCQVQRKRGKLSRLSR
jgi:hypothetical protein